MIRLARPLTIAAVATVALAACKKEEQPEGGAGKATEKPAKAAPDKPAAAPAGPFAAWDLEARKAAWQGAHVGPGDYAGSWFAYDIKGDKATIWDGTEEKTLEFQVVSPCEAKFIQRSDDGSSMSTYTHYTLKDGALVAGLGDAGSVKGKEAIACVSNKIVTLDASGTCTEWKRSMFDDGKYEQGPGTCALTEKDGKPVFTVTLSGDDYEYALLVEGDAILSEQLSMTHSEKVADFAAAKAARDAKK